jgi:saccharopine dehydrogenase-like NADP-dependent oxidoreductase
MRDAILVIGGYGHVGSKICTTLAEKYPGKIYAAGRSLEKAEAFSRATEGRVLPMRIDMSGEINDEMLSSFKMVIMCLDQQNTAFVQACLLQGIHYIDISADYDFLSKVEQLHPLAESHGSTAVLSVGLAPGLTNLLALQASRQLDTVDEINISIMLGLGDSHGRAAMEWTVDHLIQNFRTVEKGNSVERKSFSDGRAADFGSQMGKRTAYRFNFADQHILQRTLQQAPVVSTRLCFDNEWMTRAIAAMKQLGVFRLLQAPKAKDLAVNLLSTIKIGKPIYAVKIEASGRKQNKPALAECLLHGSHEAEATAAVAAEIAKQLFISKLPHGAFHIEEFFDYSLFENTLTGTGEMSERLSFLSE